MMKRFEETFATEIEAKEFIFEELVDADDVKHTSINLERVGDGYSVNWEEF